MEAGAIPIVVSNVPQTMLTFECSNPVYGRSQARQCGVLNVTLLPRNRTVALAQRALPAAPLAFHTPRHNAQPAHAWPQPWRIVGWRRRAPRPPRRPLWHWHRHWRYGRPSASADTRPQQPRELTLPRPDSRQRPHPRGLLRHVWLQADQGPHGRARHDQPASGPGGHCVHGAWPLRVRGALVGCAIQLVLNVSPFPRRAGAAASPLQTGAMAKDFPSLLQLFEAMIMDRDTARRIDPSVVPMPLDQV